MTEPRFLLDSNICIYILADAGSAPAERVQRHEPGSVVTSAIVFAEVMRGIALEDVAAQAVARRFFSQIAVQPFDADAAFAYSMRVPFRRGQFDRLIAAHALALDLTVVTANEDDFADVPGLRVENWTLPPA